MDEIWKDIDGYDGFYQSNYFDFISLDINQKSFLIISILGDEGTS